MSKRILLVGHCGADASYLRIAIRSADSHAQVLFAYVRGELSRAIEEGVDLILFNRELGYGFDDESGIDVIRSLRADHPNLKMMLITNYPDVQEAAIAAGAVPGFGKREIGSSRVVEVLRNSLAAPMQAPAHRN